MKNFTKYYMILIAAVLLLCLTITVNARNKIPREGLIAYYPFNSDFNDKSGNNFNGKVNEAVLTGAKNKACYFDGINDYIEVPGIEALKTVEQLTVSCWVKPFSVDPYDSWISKTNENKVRSVKTQMRVQRPTEWSQYGSAPKSDLSGYKSGRSARNEQGKEVHDRHSYSPASARVSRPRSSGFPPATS